MNAKAEALAIAQTGLKDAQWRLGELRIQLSAAQAAESQLAAVLKKLRVLIGNADRRNDGCGVPQAALQMVIDHTVTPALRPLALTEDRSEAQLKADGDDEP
jgi:hypothetical protein